MRHSFIFFLLFALNLSHVGAQKSPTHPNGLIYNSTTLLKGNRFYDDAARANMRHIADSLQTAFKEAPNDHIYWSKPQAIGNWFVLETLCMEAQRFLETKPDFDAFVKKFPQAKVEKNRLVLRLKGVDYDWQPNIQFRTYPEKWPFDKLEFPFDNQLFNADLKHQWISHYREPHQYLKNGMLVACFFETAFQKKPIPQEYGRQIQYVDFLADTNAIVYKNQVSRYRMDSVQLPARKILYALLFPKDPRVLPSGLFYEADQQAWSAPIFPDSTTYQHANFKNLLNAAVKEALQKKVGSRLLEDLSAAFLTPEIVFQLKRIREPSRECGNDNAPRFQDLNIAQLAAALSNWPVFIKCHLKLYHSNFDGFDAQQHRRIPAQELEVIGIDLPSFIFGAHLLFDNSAPGHFQYWGKEHWENKISIEMTEYSRLESMLSEAARNTQLDDYNRYNCWLMLQGLWKTKILYAASEAQKKTLTKAMNLQLKKTKATLPGYLIPLIKD